MEPNNSIQNDCGKEKLYCHTGNALYLLKKNEKFYLSFIIIVQTVLTMIINTLVLVTIKHTKQRKNRFLRTTRLLSIHDIAAALLGRLFILVFLNQEIKNCNVARFMFSVVVSFIHLNTGIIVFISFDRLLYVKLSQRYQLGFYNKESNIILTAMISFSVLWFIQANIKRFTPFPFVLTTIFLIISFALVGLGIAFNLLTFIMLRRYKRQSGYMVSCINQRTLRLTKIYTIFFAVFKIPYIFSVTIWIVTEWEITTKALLYVMINIISNLDAIVNAVIFFFMNKEARCYLTKKIVTLKSNILRKVTESNKNERSISACNVKTVSI